LFFEFDHQKSEANLAKHGIAFLEVQRLWEGLRSLEIPATVSDEPRSIVIG
jgi:uncharacterized DUF497 family protein